MYVKTYLTTATNWRQDNGYGNRNWLNKWGTMHKMKNYSDIKSILWTSVHSHVGFPGSSAAKESTCNAGDLSSIPGLGRSPGGGRGNPLHYSCLDNPHGQRSLAGCSPWGRRVRHNWATKQNMAHVCVYCIALCGCVLMKICCNILLSEKFKWKNNTHNLEYVLVKEKKFA